MNFENAPVSQVAKSVLGDILSVGYVIDPRAQGSISLSSGRPVEKKDMLYVLESALSANNLVMVRNASGYRIAPANEGGVGAVDGQGVGQRGARIWPDRDPAAICLRNDAVETTRRLRYASRRHSNRSERQASDRGGNWKRAPVGHRHGSQLRRRLAARAIRRHVSSAKQHAGADRRRTREDHGLGDSGLGHGLVKFQPVSRLNSILVVASKPEMLRTASRWISGSTSLRRRAPASRSTKCAMATPSKSPNCCNRSSRPTAAGSLPNCRLTRSLRVPA